jgi:hypothetical protein
MRCASYQETMQHRAHSNRNGAIAILTVARR